MMVINLSITSVHDTRNSSEDLPPAPVPGNNAAPAHRRAAAPQLRAACGTQVTVH